MTPEDFQDYATHASAVLTATKTPTYSARLAAAFGTLELLGRRFGYRICMTINAGGASVHATDPQGHEYSETNSNSLIDCALEMAAVSLGGRLQRESAAVATEYRSATEKPYDPTEDLFNDRDEGNTDG